MATSSNRACPRWRKARTSTNTQSAQHQLEDRFYMAFKANGCAMIISRLDDGLIIDVNDAFLRDYGYSLEELVGRSSLEIGLWAEPSERDHFTELLEERGSVEGFEMSGREKSGNLRRVLLAAATVEISGDKCLIITVTDITERKQSEDKRKQTEEALRESEERYRFLVENMNEGVMMLDTEGRIGYVNDSFCRMLGYAQEELLGDMAPQLFREEAARKALWERLTRRKQGIAESYELQAWKKSGETIWVNVSGAPIYDKEGCVVGSVGINTDITERKRAEEFQADLLKQLLTTQEAERRRLSMEIHDGPLQSLGVSLLAIDRALILIRRAEYAQAQKEMRDLRVSLSGTVGEVRAVLSDLSLDVLETHGLAVALEGYVERFAYVTGINVELASALARRLSPDIDLLMYRLTQEALANVRKHSGARSAVVELLEGEGTLRLTIRDDGKGFDVAETPAQHVAGHKMGLRSMRQRIEAAGGGMSIHSELGKGATLSFWCPVAGRQ